MWTTLASFVGTIGAYAAARALSGRVRHPVASPFIVGTLLIMVGLAVMHVPYAEYRAGAEPIAWLMGPATVALGIPLAKNWNLLMRNVRPLLLGGGAGAILGAAAITGMGLMLGLGRLFVIALIPKSVTTPVAVAITNVLGGEPTLAAAMTTVTGFTGALFAQPLLNRLRVRSPLARGLALGVSIHGLGTGLALQESELSAAIAGLGMTIAALVTALAAPFLVRLLG